MLHYFSILIVLSLSRRDSAQIMTFSFDVFGDKYRLYLSPHSFQLIPTIFCGQAIFLLTIYRLSEKMCTFAHLIYLFCDENKDNNLG